MQFSLVISSILLQILNTASLSYADPSSQEDLINSAAAATKLADKETVLCRSCGRGLADPHYLHTSQLSPEFLARFFSWSAAHLYVVSFLKYKSYIYGFLIMDVEYTENLLENSFVIDYKTFFVTVIWTIKK